MRLNPYCAGSRSLTKKRAGVQLDRVCLNPYCAGSRSLTICGKRNTESRPNVLILIVLEVTLNSRNMRKLTKYTKTYSLAK